jgi:hypothetical protein
MKRDYFLLNKIFGVFLLGFVAAGCGALHNYKAYEGEARKVEELAVIKGESRIREGSLDKNYRDIDHILVQIATVDNKQTSWMFSRMPQSVLVEPGRRSIVVRYKNGESYAFGRLWLNAEMGKTYIVKTHIKNYSIIFRVEDEQTGENVGVNPGSEPENNNIAPPKA